jgi:hypothetical protein
MNIVVTPENRFRDAQREINNLRMENLDLKEIAAEQEFYICLLELGVNINDL